MLLKWGRADYAEGTKYAQRNLSPGGYAVTQAENALILFSPDAIPWFIPFLEYFSPSSVVDIATQLSYIVENM